MNVLTAAWIGTGAPASSSQPGATGLCARCACRAAIVPVQAAISKSFTGFDSWTEPYGQGLCPACAWAYSTTQLRLAAHLVSRQPAALQRLERASVHALLRTGAVRSDIAVVVPLRPGRKHVLPDARWGRVTVEDAHLPWSEDDASRLRTLAELRGRGFGSRMLAESAPAFQVLRRLPRELWEPTMRAWGQLDPWRAPDSPWLALAVHITTPSEHS